MNITVLLSNFCPWPGCISTVSLSAVHVLLSRFYVDFILILSRFLVTHFIQILSRLYPNFWKNLDKVGKNTLSRFYPNFILFFWKNQDKIWIKGHGRAPSILQRNSVFLFF